MQGMIGHGFTMSRELAQAQNHLQQAKAFMICHYDGHKGINIATSDTHDSYLCECCMTIYTVGKSK